MNISNEIIQFINNITVQNAVSQCLSMFINMIPWILRVGVSFMLINASLKLHLFFIRIWQKKNVFTAFVVPLYAVYLCSTYSFLLIIGYSWQYWSWKVRWLWWWEQVKKCWTHKDFWQSEYWMRGMNKEKEEGKKK